MPHQMVATNGDANITPAQPTTQLPRHRPRQANNAPDASTAPTRIKNRALWYIEKYHPSSRGLQLFLQRFAHKNFQDLAPSITHGIIQQLIMQFEQLGLINDDKLAKAYYDQYARLGYSHIKIGQKLRAKGFTMPDNAVLQADKEWENAHFFANKRRIWHLPQEKFMRRLAAAGFSFEIARQLWQEKLDNHEQEPI